jgi:quinol monooxygenase YgiN
MDGGEVALTGWITVPPGELARLRPLLDEHIRLTLAEPGCLAFAVTPNAENSARLEVTDRFRDRAAFEAHQRRTAASAWGAATRHLERRYRIVAE